MAIVILPVIRSGNEREAAERGLVKRSVTR
jgi:hypothetical protein